MIAAILMAAQVMTVGSWETGPVLDRLTEKTECPSIAWHTEDSQIVLEAKRNMVLIRTGDSPTKARFRLDNGPVFLMLLGDFARRNGVVIIADGGVVYVSVVERTWPEQDMQRRSFDFKDFLRAKRFRFDITITTGKNFFGDVRLSETDKIIEMLTNGKCE
jgi:hypothetical protein